MNRYKLHEPPIKYVGPMGGQIWVLREDTTRAIKLVRLMEPETPSPEYPRSEKRFARRTWNFKVISNLLDEWPYITENVLTNYWMRISE